MSPCKFFPLSFRACIFHHHSLLNNILSSWLINYFNFVFILQIPNIAIIFNFRKFTNKGIANPLQRPYLNFSKFFCCFILLFLQFLMKSLLIFFEIVVVDVEDVAAVAFVIFGQFFGSMTWPYLCYIHKDLTFQGQKLIRH